MGVVTFLVLILSLVFMRDNYEHLQKRSREGVSAREQLAFLKYFFAFYQWLVLMLGVSLFLDSVPFIWIFIILFFYTHLLYLIPRLLYSFFPNLNFR